MKLGMLAGTHYVEVVRLGLHDMGAVSVVRSRPFRVEGKVELGSEFGGKVWVKVRMPASAERQRPRPKTRSLRLKVRDGTLAFEWTCETPEMPVVFELSRTGGPAVEQTTSPVPNGVVPLTLRLP